ncbi:MAG: Maf family protein [Bacteroidia bacterium]|nr:Maf family protein [Bacteroidia bacterium]
MLLRHLGLRFEVKVIPTSEDFPAGLQGAEIPLFLAKKKAEPFFPLQENELLITADTIVWLNGKVLNKPGGRAEAIRMLQELQGKTHEVYSGVGLHLGSENRYFAVQSEVRFLPLSTTKIEEYVDACCPYDKAGAYGAQEFLQADVNACCTEEMKFIREMRLTELEKDCYPSGNKHIPFHGVESVSGSYFNVMGFPVRECWEEIMRMVAT